MYAVLAAQIREHDPKPWWQSRGIIGALAVLGAQLGNAFALQLDADQLTEVALNIITAAGGVLALVGRARARAPIAGPRG